jgi:hypothetical protein
MRWHYIPVRIAKQQITNPPNSDNANCWQEDMVPETVVAYANAKWHSIVSQTIC